MIAWPSSLTEDLARRKAVLFLGSGISSNARGDNHRGPPMWEEFLRTALDRCENPKKHISSLLKRSDFLTACEILRDRLDEHWNPLLTELFSAPRFQPAPIHESIFRLDSRVVLTQNFDKIYDTLAQQKSDNTIAIKNYYDADVAAAIRDHRQIIIKAHGTIDAPDRMIFTRTQYRDAQHQFAAFYDLLDALIVTHTFLFLGCGLADPDVQMLLSRHAGKFPASKPHYFCLGATTIPDDVAESIRRNYNLKILRYSPRANHSELLDSLNELIPLVDAKRDEIAETQRW